jgi:glucose/arabinose dehydrogenase
MRLRRLSAAAIAAASMIAAAVIVNARPAAAVPALPAGFVLTDLSSGQAAFDLTDFVYLPDGGLLSTGKKGNVAYVSPTGQATSIATIPVMTNNDLGLISIALDKDYATNRKIYLLSNHSYTPPGGGTALAIDRLSSWTVTGTDHPTGLANGQTIFEYTQPSYIHALWGIVVGADGTLWLTTGDGGWHTFVDPQALTTMNLDQPYGKMLHINPDGTGVATNPYYDPANPTSWRSRVYASGFRSPFRFSFDPASGTPILGDVGWNTTEEVDVISPGSFYGWPCWEGPNQTPGYKDMAQCANVGTVMPIFSYPRSFGGSAVTGGIVYTGTSYPAQYRGAYFFGDYAGNRLWTMLIGAGNAVTRAPENAGFATDIGAPVKFNRAPNGDIVYADIVSGNLRRLSYAAGNRAPVAKATSTNDPNTRTVSFDSAETYDPDGDLLKYHWDFGDGTNADGATATHTYAAPGTTPLTATLTVTDSLGASSTDQLTIVPANHAPDLTTQFQAASTTYKVGDTVSSSATATDVEDGTLTVSWSSYLLHCNAVGCHTHPGPGGTGPTFSTTFQDHGDNTELRITASATDSRGVVTERTFVAHPRQHTLNLVSNVPAAMLVGDQATNNPQVTAGATVTITAATTSADGSATFENWTDGAPRQRQLVMPDSDTTLTATYLTAIDRRYASDAAFRATLGAPTAPEIAEGTSRLRVYQFGRAYWSLATDVHEVHGAILTTYLGLGGSPKLGPPTTDETTTADKVGRYNNFAKPDGPASIYWSPGTGAHEVYGVIRGKWAEKGLEAGILGYPVTGENGTPDGVGRYNHFNKGASIYFTPGTGAHEVHGSIRGLWEQLNWEKGVLGYPITDETTTPDGIGRYNHFNKGGSIYWSPGTGAHEVYGAIMGRWSRLGYERSYLGYPTSGEYSVPGGRRNDFQHGYIFWNASNGQVTDVRR